MNRETVGHLVGYSTLSLVLGTASWSTFGWVFALPLALGTLAIVGYHGAKLLAEKARVDVDIQPKETAEKPETVTDGGRSPRLSPAQVADSVRDHGSENVQDATIVRAIEQGEANAGGGRNRRRTSENEN